MKTLLVFLIAFMASISSAWAACGVKSSSGQPAGPRKDPLYLTLLRAPKCPESVLEFKDELTSVGLVYKPYLVSNRGFHNTDSGSLSLFEEVTGASPGFAAPIAPGDFMFGHFTTIERGAITLDTRPAPGKLLIEVISWDPAQQLFHFYEMIGTATGAEWFYRGDSTDALKDNTLLYRGNSNQPAFGSRMRCSGCHASGGPIMKELALPHNDWWTAKRPLPLAGKRLSPDLQEALMGLADANGLSVSVQAATKKLFASPAYTGFQRGLSLQEKLRPLFCETEINLESDASANASFVQIPSASLVNPLLAKGKVGIPKAAYSGLLRAAGMVFQESNRPDADHAWLTPVKATANLIAIENMVKGGVIDAEFAMDVLATDMETPVLSKKRCSLLKLLPQQATGGWKMKFAEALKASQAPEALELFGNLTDPRKNGPAHRMAAQAVLAQAQELAKSADGQKKLFTKLVQTRNAVKESEISKNPRGQILEPGFRVIFPEPRSR